MRKFLVVFSCLALTVGCLPSIAQDQTETGEGVARKYFQKRRSAPAQNSRRDPAAAAPRYLTVHLGGFVSEEAYKWGDNNEDDLAKLNGGVTYRMGEWVNSMDFMFRADFTSFELREDRALKMALLPLLIFPDAASGFPLYFGGGLGLGVFFKQIENESSLAVDYQIFAGVRLFDVFDSFGVIIETGLKNHFHLFSDGQYNGVFLTGGLLFNF